MSGPSFRRGSGKRFIDGLRFRLSAAPAFPSARGDLAAQLAGDGVDVPAVRSATTDENAQTKATAQSRAPICKHLGRLGMQLRATVQFLHFFVVAQHLNWV